MKISHFVGLVILAALLTIIFRKAPAEPLTPPQPIVAKAFGWVKLTSTPTPVVGKNTSRELLWQAEFQITDSETLSAIIVESVNTLNPDSWKVGEEVLIANFGGKAHGNLPLLNYIVIDHRPALEVAENAK